MTVPEFDSHRREVAELQAKINLLLAMSSLADADLKHKDETIKHRDETISRLSSEVREKENLRYQAAEALREVTRLQTNLDEMLVSTSWKVSAPLRWLKEKIRR